MPQKISPFVESKYGWNYGESGWNSGMDENLTKFSFLFDRNIDAIVSTLPTNPANGQAFFLTTDNRMYFRVDSSWYSTPTPKWFEIQIRATGEVYRFNGASLELVESSSSIDNRIDALEITASSLGTAAFEDAEYFASQSELDIASAEAANYTDTLRTELSNNSGDGGAALVGYKGRSQADRNADVISVRDYITTPVDGVTSNQAGIVAAVAAAAAVGADLLWPAGTYVSDANIPNFHSVRHTGVGVVKRGTDTFKISTLGAQQNVLYISPTGSDANDGLTATTPLATIQRAFDLIQTTWLAAVKTGAWVIRLAAGTYGKATLQVNLGARERLVLEGPPANYGVPTAIVDGMGVNNQIGLYIRNNNYMVVKDVKLINFPGTNGQGLTGDTGCDLYADNVHATGCGWVGINLSGRGQLRTRGGLLENCGRGVRLYGNTVFSVGYASETYRQVIRNCVIGIEAQNSSQGHIDYTDISGCDTGISLVNQSRAHIVASSVTDCNVGVKAQANSTFGESGGNVFSGNTLDRICHGFSMPFEHQDYMYYAPDSKTYRFNASLSGVSPVSTAQYVFELGSGKSGIQLLSSDTATFGISFGTPSGGGRGQVAYRDSDGFLRFIAANALSFSAGSTDLRPGADNARSLGTAAIRWSNAYVATGAINTSDERSKQQIKPIDEAALRAWGRVEYVQYKFNDAVEQKGDGARWHFGLIAQRVKEAFEAEGLNAFDYGLLCYDEWGETPAVEEEPYSPAGNRYGIRYEEALALECAYLRSLMSK